MTVEAALVRTPVTTAALVPTGVPGVERLRERGVLDLAEQVCAAHGVELADVMSATKNRRIVSARRALWAALRGLGWTYAQIAWPWAYDYTTVYAGLVRVERVRAARPLREAA